MSVLRKVFDCPRSCEAMNTLQNKPIPAPKPTPFLEDQIKSDCHSHEMQSAQGLECMRTELGPGTVFLYFNGRITPLGESCVNTSYSLTESQPCKYGSRLCCQFLRLEACHHSLPLARISPVCN